MKAACSSSKRRRTVHHDGPTLNNGLGLAQRNLYVLPSWLASTQSKASAVLSLINFFLKKIANAVDPIIRGFELLALMLLLTFASKTSPQSSLIMVVCGDEARAKWRGVLLYGCIHMH